MRPIIRQLLLIVTALPAITAAMPAAAQTCFITSVTAGGEPSRALWLAKTKARSNWRQKVRLMPRLGAEYANWSQAENTAEMCTLQDGKHHCRARATPCKQRR